MLPLQGVRVLAITQYAAGPFGTMLLADFGAEVINLEDPETGGDLGRWVPPTADGHGDSLFYQAFNRGKRSVTLNLRTPGGRAVLEQLAARSDALVANLRGDQPKKLRIDYDGLKQANPGIVCVHASGFGAAGPRLAEPCFDYLVQACLGMMDLTGDPEGPPERAGLSFVDFSTGLVSAFGVLLGLQQRQRTGLGCDVQTSLLQTGLSYLNYVAAYWLNAHLALTRLAGSAHPTVAPSQRFRTQDGYILVMAQTEKFWRLLCEALQRPDLLADPRYADQQARFAHAQELRDRFGEIFAQQTSEHWLALLRGKVPCAPVNTVAAGLQDPQVAAIGGIIEVARPDGSTLREMAPPLRLAGAAPGGHPTPAWAAPALGADTDAVLRDLLGLDAAAIARLRAEGAV